MLKQGQNACNQVKMEIEYCQRKKNWDIIQSSYS